MTFWFSPFSDLIKKKVCRYLLHRYLGSFIQEKINLDQLNVDFYNGTGKISDIVLSPEALNELCENQGWDIEIKAGNIGQIDVNIPWNALMSEDSLIEISDLYLEGRPKCRPKDGSSMIESMWSSMSSSIQLAQDCLEHESGSSAHNQPMEGLERFAQIIDSVLNRIKIRLKNTVIRLEYSPNGNDRGIAIIMKIDKLEYKNEAGGDPPDEPANAPDVDGDDNGPKTYLIPVYSTHQLLIENVTFYMEEFRISKPNMKDDGTSQMRDSVPVAEQFYSTISELPEIQTMSINQDKSCDEVSSGSDDDNETTISDIYDVNRSESLQIACFHGKIDIKITVKQTVAFQGPKVQLEIQLGAVNIFLSPRQLHALIHVMNVFFEETNTTGKLGKQCRDPDQSGEEQGTDFKAYNAMTGNLSLNQCWSTDPVAEPGPSGNAKLNSDTIRETNSMSNSITSFASGYTQTTVRNRLRGIIEVDPNADILRTNIRVSSCAIILLEEDVLVESPPDEESPLNENSVRKLKQITEKFFQTNQNIDTSLGAKDLKSITALLDAGCKRNHIRLILAPIIIEGEEQRNSSGILLRLSISIPRAELKEILKDTAVPLLEFVRDTSSGALPKRPEISILLKQTTNMLGSAHGFAYESPKTELSFMIAPCLSELDISIMDRLSPVFNGSPYIASKISDAKTGQKNNSGKNGYGITLESPQIDVRLRFPCTDLRPIHTPDRVPWWKRNVLRDSLYIQFSQAKFSFRRNKYDIVADKIDIYYSENEEGPKIHIGNVVPHEDPSDKHTRSTNRNPRILIEIPSLETIESNIQKQQTGDDNSDGCHHSDFSFNMSSTNESSPFSAKHVWRESDTPHRTDDHEPSAGKSSQNIADDEKLLIPGDSTEINHFSDESEETSQLKIVVTLPTVSLQLRSKHMYEVIYNRIISNFLLWSPSAPNNTTKPQMSVGTNNPLFNINMTDSISIPFSMAKSNIIFDSSSTTNSDTDSDSEDIFYSTCHDTKRAQQKPQQNIVQSSICSFRLNIGRGLLTAYAPVRDSQNRVIPGQQGEFVIKIRDASLFSVGGYRGDDNLNYLCVQASAIEMYHLGLIPVPSLDPPLRIYGCVLPSHVQSTIYPTPLDLTVNQAAGKTESNREMLSIAVQIKSVPDRKVKRIKVSAGIELATLRYNSTLPEHSWLRQIMDMFNVEDYPIQGYTPLTNIMEMHLHLWDCSVDYRPRFFDYRAILAINTFMISTTLSSTNIGCTVRFVAEDGTVSIAPHTPPGEFKFKNENKISSLSSCELVCVFEFALFEISLRECDKVTEFAPKNDGRAAMNGAHLRVCSDSCTALGNLCAYMAGEGDLTPLREIETEHSDPLMDSSRELDVDLLFVNTQNSPEVTEDQQKRVNQLMEEAMQEDSVRITSTRTKVPTEAVVEEDAETFFFPDEADPYSDRYSSSSSGISSLRVRKTQSSTSLNRDDDDQLSNITDGSRRKTTDLLDIIDFEKSIMGLKDALETEAVEAIPLVDSELGVITHEETRRKLAKLPNRRMSSDTDDDFCFIGDEEKPKCGIDPVLPSEEPIRIVDNHFSIPLDKHDMLKAPQGFPQAVTRYTVCDLSISVHLYGGNDFPTTNNDKEKEYERSSSERIGMSDAYKKGVAFSKITSTVTLPSKQRNETPKSQRPWKERGGLNRNFDVLIEIHSNKGRFSYEIYPSHTREASRQVLVLSDFEVWDRLSSSSFNKMFYTGRNERSEKSDQATVYIKCIFIRPEPSLPSQEANLYISCMPKVNINIDQDAILFLTDFFAQLNGNEEHPKPKTATTPLHHPPVMIVGMPELRELQARKMVDKNLMLLIDDEKEEEKAPTEVESTVADNNPVYFRSVTFSPEVELTINYCGKRVQMSHGPMMGLIMGLSQLNCSKIKLKKIHYRRGLLGLERVLYHLIKEWLNHIKNSQLRSLLQGIGPMNSIVIFFQGVIDLFRLPYEQYQRDGRIVRGLQLGAQSFTSRTALAALELTTRLIYLLQITAETAYDMVSPGPSVKAKNRRRGKRKLHRPQDIREGVTNAYYIVKEGVGDTAHNVVEIASMEHDRKGVTGAVGAVIRQIPPSIVMPIVLAAQATTNVLGGVRNQLVPDAQIEAKEKWKQDED